MPHGHEPVDVGVGVEVEVDVDVVAPATARAALCSDTLSLPVCTTCTLNVCPAEAALYCSVTTASCHVLGPLIVPT